jgi:hypothetical protein
VDGPASFRSGKLKTQVGAVPTIKRRFVSIFRQSAVEHEEFMPSVPWDRLLETCYKREAEVAVLVPGSPPLVWVGDTFRALQVPPLTVEDLDEMVEERLGEAPEFNADGYAYVDFWYGDVVFYRVMAFGFPSTKALVLSRCKPTHPAPENPAAPSAGA